jgi:hypothetical protein
MKLALRILVTALVAGLLAVPAASAKPGGGNGHGKGAEKAKAAHEHKAGKEKKAKKDKGAKKAGKADKAKEHGKKAEAESCDAPSAAAEVLSGLFGSTTECEADEEDADEQEQAELALDPPDLEGLGPGQYCHQLEAWMAANGGDFSQTFGTEGSGYANDHGKCASRRAHGEDLLAAATEAVPEQEQAEEDEQLEEQELELPNLEDLGPGQYCHALEAWMAANGGNFSQSFGTEGSGYANDHGKCASRRAHGEDLAPAALHSVCDAAKAAGGELPEACKPAEEQQAEQVAPAAAELTAVLRLLSF